MALFYMPGTTGDSGLYADDSSGYIFDQVLKRLAKDSGQRVSARSPRTSDDSVNAYVRGKNLVLCMRDPDGNTSVLSANYRNKLPPAFIERLQQHFGVKPDDAVLWADDVYNAPRRVTAREVIWNQALKKAPKETVAQKKKHWEHPDGLSQEEMDYLMGRTQQPPP